MATKAELTQLRSLTAAGQWDARATLLQRIGERADRRDRAARARCDATPGMQAFYAACEAARQAAGRS